MPDLFDALDTAVRTLTQGRDVAVAFSGGLDSSVVAVLAMKYASSVRLYTVGTEGSYDAEAGRRVAALLGAEWVYIPMDMKNLESGLRNAVSVTGSTDPVLLSFEVPLMYILPAAEERYVIGGQGADEALWGYSKYLGLSEDELRRKAAEDFDTLRNVTLRHESKMASHYGKEVLYPFLDAEVSQAVSSIPFADMVPLGDSRKRPLKAVAEKLGYPEIAAMKKKAAQYGTGSMGMIKKLAKSRGMTVSEYTESLKEGPQ